jgi:hypothetical protein
MDTESKAVTEAPGVPVTISLLQIRLREVQSLIEGANADVDRFDEYLELRRNDLANLYREQADVNRALAILGAGQ